MPGRKRARTLAEELEDLTNPAPAVTEVDPELHDFGTETALRSDSDLSDQEEADRSSTRRGLAGGRLQLRGDIALEGGHYAGKRGSRKDALEEGEEDGAWSMGDDEGPEEEALANLRPRKGQAGKSSQEEADATEEDESGSEDEEAGSKSSEEEEEGRGTKRQKQEEDGVDEEEAELEREYRLLRQQEEEMAASVKARSGADVEKGRAVNSQRVLWDRWLEVRIQLQRALVPANRLPQAGTWEAFCKGSEAVAKGMEGLASAAADTLGLLVEVQQALMDQNEAIGKAAEAASAAREEADGDGAEQQVVPGSSRSDMLWQAVDKHYRRLAPYRDAAIDRWQRKTMLATGAAAARGRLRALNQSVSAQVAAALRDPSRLIKRTQARRSAVPVFGQSLAAAEPNEIKATNDGFANQAADGGVEEEEVDPETFDDSDFYQQLLKEFLDQSGATSGMSLYSLQKLRNNKKKVVDRRASKGRKIRYTVQQPLVNFMAPEPMVIPPMAAKLFTNLFGQAGQA